MAVVNYTLTSLADGRALIEWVGLVANDTGQPFEAIDASTVFSVHAYRGIGDTIEVDIFGSNEVATPTRGFRIAGGGFGSFNDALQSIPIKSRWIYPVVDAGTGTATAILLIDE